MRNSILSFSIIIAIAALLNTACQSNGNSPGRTFLPDMTYSNAYETYSSTKFQNQSEEDSISALLPQDGTIPRGYFPKGEDVRNDEALMMSHMFKNYFQNPTGNPGVDDNAQRELAKTALKNPYQLSDEVLARGEKVYNIYCAVCHGKGGIGDGSIVILPDGSEGPYTAIPPAFATRLPGLSDGEIFYSISYGKNMMGGYFTQVSVTDRWNLVHYIKGLGGLNGDVVSEAETAASDSTTVAEGI